MSDKATEMVAKTQSKVHTIKMKGIYGGLDGTYARARRAEKYRNKGRAHNVHVGAITRYIWGKRKVPPTPPIDVWHDTFFIGVWGQGQVACGGQGWECVVARVGQVWGKGWGRGTACKGKVRALVGVKVEHMHGQEQGRTSACKSGAKERHHV